jgi:hypothetical protein
MSIEDKMIFMKLVNLSHYINDLEDSGRIRLLQGNMLTKGAEDECE